jgi:hypothetical protein
MVKICNGKAMYAAAVSVQMAGQFLFIFFIYL